MIFVAEFDAIVDAIGTVETILVSTVPFTTKPTDTPDDTAARHRLLNPGNFARSVSGDKMLMGLTRIQHGQLEFANADGALDAWQTYGVGDQPVIVRCATTMPTSYPSGWTTVFACTAESISGGRDIVILRLKELTSILDKPMCDAFLGTGGIEGTAEMAGDPKPRTFGACYNVSPTLLDAQQLIYRVSSRGSVSANHAKDDGSVIARALTAGDDGSATTVDQDAYETYAALAAATVPIGQYVTVASLGLLKLGSEPAGQLTADLHEYTGPSGPAYGAGDRWASGGTGTPGQDISCYWGNVIKTIALDAGVASGDISAADVTSGGTGQFGFHARDTSTTWAQAAGAIAESAGAWCGFDRTGTLRFQVLAEPATSNSVYTITPDNAISLEPAESKFDDGVPIWKVNLKYPKNYTPQSSFAGIVPQDVRAEASKEWPRSFSFDEAATLTQYPNAGTFDLERHTGGYRVTSDGALNINGDEDPFITSLVDLFSVKRQWFTAKLPLSTTLLTTVDIGSFVTLRWPRWELDAGKKFFVLGVRYELSGAPWVSLSLWG